MSYIGKQPTKAALTASDIEDGIITAAKIEDGAVVAAEIASNAVTTAKINADAVTGAKIADDAINSEHYTDGSIDTAHLADGQVTTAKLASAVFTGATDIGAAIVDADLFLMDDGAGGTIRKTAASRIKTYAGGLTGVSTGSGNVTITDGNLVLASGHGIDFAATGNVSGTSSELLDDYEEGTWTPGINQGTINNISSSYIKVGNKVTVFSNIDTFSNRTSTETVEVSSLPFAIASATQGKAVGSVLIRYSDKLVSAAYSRSGTAIGFYASIASGYVPLKFNDLNNSSANMTFIATYTV